MALIDRVKERTGTLLSDAELGLMIAGIASEIDALVGAAGPIEQSFGDAGESDMRWRRTLTLARPLDPAESVTIVESSPGDSGAAADDTTLVAADYRVLHGGRTLQRVYGGPNSERFWAPFVTVTYTPLVNQAARDEVTIKLMALDLSYRGGLKSERAGDYQFTLGTDPASERELLLASLVGAPGFRLG